MRCVNHQHRRENDPTRFLRLCTHFNRAARCVAQMENEMTESQFYCLFAAVLVTPHIGKTGALVLAFIVLGFAIWAVLK